MVFDFFTGLPGDGCGLVTAPPFALVVYRLGRRQGSSFLFLFLPSWCLLTLYEEGGGGGLAAVLCFSPQAYGDGAAMSIETTHDRCYATDQPAELARLCGFSTWVGL